MNISKEHYEMMDAFEKLYSHYRLDREPKELWPKQIIYQNGMVNNLFLAFRRGVLFGRLLELKG